MKRLALVSLLFTACGAPAGSPPSASEPLRLGKHHFGLWSHVLLVSVDGLHALDLDRFVGAHPGSTLARLSKRGLTYSDARSTAPSDSFPGILALVAGGTPAVTGVYYDDAYDRALSPPGSACATVGTETVYDESIDKNPDALDAGGGIDPAQLPLDPRNGCSPVYPHQFLRVNTLFEVVRDFGGRTAWSDKHPAYDLLNGPSGRGVDDLYTPEIAAGGVTGQVATTEAYDDLKVQAVLKWIAGQDHAGNPAPVPTVFGMNFQAVSVGQKTAGYLDGAGTPTPPLDDALAHVDASLGQIDHALYEAGIAEDTLLIVTAKHGQSPIDPAARHIVDKKLLASTIESVKTGITAQLTTDDIALVWLSDPSRTADVVKALEAQRGPLEIDEIYSGAQLALLFGDAAGDSRRPDLAIQPRTGVIYAKPTATKVAEHGGFAEDDRHVALLMSSPGLAPERIRQTVATTQVAPTILRALGLPGELLAAVEAEGTAALPDLFWF